MSGPHLMAFLCFQRAARRLLFILTAFAMVPRILASEHANSAHAASPAPAEAAAKPEKKPVEGAFEQPTSDVMAEARAALLSNQMDLARSLRLKQLASQAEPVLVELLADENPDTTKQDALLELALCAQDQNELPRAQQIYSQFLSRWPNDPRVPEILLRQGMFFREMGMSSMALTKFYGVMTAALALKSDRFDYYKKIVAQSQNEIAETHFQMGKFAEAVEYFSRLLKQDNPLLDRSLVQYRLIRALSELGQHEAALGQAQDFLVRFPNATERAEVRFIMAHCLKEQGRNNESLQQVLTLLKEQKRQTTNNPEIWSYWQRRAGNEIANALYRDGDYPKALEVYLNLAELDAAPAWQLPVQYQVGLTYEKMQQPQMATRIYSNIITREIDLGTNRSPALKSVLEMARWRVNFLNWETRAENATKEYSSPGSAAKDAKDSKS
ncbi:MAG: tetratricopeptide repeat protein [Verrucomicrobiota bacterium]